MLTSSLAIQQIWTLRSLCELVMVNRLAIVLCCADVQARALLENTH